MNEKNTASHIVFCLCKGFWQMFFFCYENIIRFFQCLFFCVGQQKDLFIQLCMSKGIKTCVFIQKCHGKGQHFWLAAVKFFCAFLNRNHTGRVCHSIQQQTKCFLCIKYIVKCM